MTVHTINSIYVAGEGGNKGLGEHTVKFGGIDGANVFTCPLKGMQCRVRILIGDEKIALSFPSTRFRGPSDGLHLLQAHKHEIHDDDHFLTIANI